MYNHNGYQAQHGMLNGGQNHPRYGMQMPKYQQSHHPHHNQMSQHHGQHHHGGNIGHQHTVSSGGFSHATPHLGQYGQDHGQNGNVDGLHQDDLEDVESEHWQEQLRLAQESREAGAPHQRAKYVAQQSKGINFVPNSMLQEQESNADERNLAQQGQKNPHQTWNELDFGGQGVRALSDALFQYTFLERLILTHNNLDRLPPAIGRLKNLEHLDVSHNQLVELPEEIGMLTNLKSLWLFSNQIQTFPDQLGFLYKLQTLGIEGNPIAEDLKDRMMEDGTKGLIRYLREHMERE